MKVTVVGAGAVGASCAEYIAIKDFASEVVLLDIKEGYAEGKAMDLMQMAKVSAALARHDAAGGLFISVLTNPTMGGVAASFASLGDVVFAEPKALIGFAGPRTIKATIRIELPEGFQTSEFLLKHGFIDRIVHREKLKSEGILKGKEKVFEIQKNLSYTDAQKQDVANYSEGMVVQFHQNIKGGIKRGTKYHVSGKDENGKPIANRFVDRSAQCLVAGRD